tara:strand:+ start:1418 stop:1534 length:117 start_codon:yes stop_codon:yes gene_type:complete
MLLEWDCEKNHKVLKDYLSQQAWNFWQTLFVDRFDAGD